MKSNQQSVWARVGKSVNQQGYLGFEMIVAQANVVSAGVKRLARWSREYQVEDAAKVGGGLREVGYTSWLAFYSPLSSRGN